MRATLSIGSVLASFVVIAFVTAAWAQVTPQDKVLDFAVMAAVVEPFTGSANPIRAVPASGLPWEIDRGTGVLRANGDLDIHVEGLVLARRTPVPPNQQGTNPVTDFRAIVSCLTVNGNGLPAEVNASTDNFPATAAGDARILATVELPTPCLAPIIFVTTSGGAWLTITGR